jgi:glycosyltransferase involved in cell wall biosynthesis
VAEAPRDKVTLMLPTLNEIDGMKWFVPRLDKEAVDKIVVADGGSTDGTLEYCRERGYAVLIQSGKGLPNAEEEVFPLIQNEIMVMCTPDGNSLPELIPPLVAKVREGYDMVIASRYVGGAKSEDDDAFTAVGNRIFTGMINFLFGGHYTDALVGLRAYRRAAVIRMGLPRLSSESWLTRHFWRMNSWETGSSIRAAKLKLKVCEIPGDEPKRIGGVRKMSVVKSGLGTLFQVIREAFIGNRF